MRVLQHSVQFLLLFPDHLVLCCNSVITLLITVLHKYIDFVLCTFDYRITAGFATYQVLFPVGARVQMQDVTSYWQ